MKIVYSLFLLLFVMSCVNPQKLVEQGKYDRALKVSTRQLKKGKVKWKQLSAFEKSFTVLNRRDSVQVSELRAAGQPELWPKIYNKAVQISNRQEKVVPVLDRLANTNFEPAVTLYPANSLLEEAADKSALYYYAAAMEFIETARTGNRQNARKAHTLLEQCRNYRINFKDAPLLQQEMYALGTTHILIQPIVGNYDPYFDSRLFLQVIGSKKYPLRLGWQVFHREEKSIQRPHYFLELKFYNLDVSSNRHDESTCCNTETIEDGYVKKKVWNESDSAWVVVKEVVYKEVSVQVTTHEQMKSASLRMHFSLVDVESNREVDYKSFYGCSRWSNNFSVVCGDHRALTLLCDDDGGCYRSFPHEKELLNDAACNIRYGFYKAMKRVEG